jgi:tetratricopeptide (TPR) repeat protein
VRHRFYWWNNAAVEVWNDSLICYPMRWTASHGFTNVDTWPVNRAGLDLRVVGNHTAGPVSQFAHGSREPCMGVYHPRTGTGTVHFARYEELPHKKIWAWGVDADGLDWRKALSDNESAYVEIQGGLFRNQETYAFLQPGERLEFSEYWMPVRAIGGISRANLHGVVNIANAGGRASVALNVNHAIENATVRLRDGERVVHSETRSLRPEDVWTRDLPAPSGKLTFELLDKSGNPLLVHTDGRYDWAPEADIKVGPQEQYRAPAPDKRTEADWLEAATDQELNGRKIEALTSYRNALKRHPNSVLLQRAAGRLAVDLKQYEAAIEWLRAAQARVSNDPEIHYYLGLAFEALGRTRDARTEYEGAYRLPLLRDAARVRLGGIAAREQDWTAALRFLSGTVYELPVLRKLGRDRAAVLSSWTAADPAGSFVRLEAGAGESLWRHFAADPNRVIEAASIYIHLGMWDDALRLLERRYPEASETEREPGMVLPQNHALVSYYRGFVRGKTSASNAQDYQTAAVQPLNYVFPHRADSFPVLEDAISANPQDASARYLLGSLYMSGGMVDKALAEWQRARSLNKSIPVLHRNIARTLLEIKHDYKQAAEVYQEGLAVDARNVELFSGLTQSLALMGKPAAERVAALEKYPDRDGMPAGLVYELALSLAEAGRYSDAERLFHGRFFPREEGGTNVRQVWIEVQLQKALAAGDANAIRRLVDPVPALDWTKDGMSEFLRGARFHYLAGVAAERGGDKSFALEYWRKAAEAWDTPQIAYAREAARRLPAYNDGEWKGRVERRLAQLERADDEGASGPVDVWRGTILHSIGQTDDAGNAFREALLGPDRGLSRYLARVEQARMSR